MSIDNNKPGGIVKREWIKRKVIPLSTLLLAIAIIVGLFFYGRNPERLVELQKYQYVGAFLISLVGNASILLPGVVLPMLSSLGAIFYPVKGLLAPVLVGLAGGAGAAIGETVGYMAGYSGHGIIENRKLYNKLEEKVKRWGTIIIFVFALAPLFFDLVGLAAGALRFPLWKFIIICWVARTLLYVTVVVLTALGWEIIAPYLG